MNVDWTALIMLGVGFASGVFFAPLLNPRLRRAHHRADAGQEAS